MSTRWLPDVNVWLALSVKSHAHERIARGWFERTDGTIWLCRAAQQGLLRLLTTRAVMTPYMAEPLTNRQAIAAMRALLALDNVHLATEPEGMEADWTRYADHHLPSPKLWMDAYLAAFAITGGFRIVTTDNGFKQFKGLTVLVL